MNVSILHTTVGWKGDLEKLDTVLWGCYKDYVKLVKPQQNLACMFPTCTVLLDGWEI